LDKKIRRMKWETGNTRQYKEDFVVYTHNVVTIEKSRRVRSGGNVVRWWSYFRALCQQNEGYVEIKRRPIKMGGRTTYRTLSPKRAPFQIGID
jgi:hypothetical protein